MTVKEIVLSLMPANLTQIEKAHYIYIKLGELLTFSTKFKNSTTKDYVDLYSKSVNSSNLKYNQVTCSMWAKVYEDLLHCVGINDYTVKFRAGKVSRKGIKYRLFKKSYGSVKDYDESQIGKIGRL